MGIPHSHKIDPQQFKWIKKKVDKFFTLADAWKQILTNLANEEGFIERELARLFKPISKLIKKLEKVEECLLRIKDLEKRIKKLEKKG